LWKKPRALEKIQAPREEDKNLGWKGVAKKMGVNPNRETEVGKKTLTFRGGTTGTEDTQLKNIKGAALGQNNLKTGPRTEKH